MDGYSGDAGDAIAGHESSTHFSNGMMFTTLDSDNDDIPSINCAVNRGGWWHNRCSASIINMDDDGTWITIGWPRNVQASRMLVKRD